MSIAFRTSFLYNISKPSNLIKFDLSSGDVTTSYVKKLYIFISLAKGETNQSTGSYLRIIPLKVST